MSFEEKLISAVEKNPILYKKSAGGYKNISIKCRIWNSIAKELLQTGKLKIIVKLFYIACKNF